VTDPSRAARAETHDADTSTKWLRCQRRSGMRCSPSLLSSTMRLDDGRSTPPHTKKLSPVSILGPVVSPFARRSTLVALTLGVGLGGALACSSSEDEPAQGQDPSGSTGGSSAGDGGSTSSTGGRLT